MKKNLLKKLSFALTIALSVSALSTLARAEKEEEPVERAKIVPTEEIYTCPKSLEMNADAIEQNIAHYIKEKQITVAAKLAADCAVWGSNIDVAIISPVSEAFSADLAKALKDEQKNELKAKLKLCSDRYTGGVDGDGFPKNGSMGASASAHCSLKVYSAYDSLYGPRDL
ncbi:MAG TPA: hypothetical protein VM901_10525 [Bdellovibrionota bacterium]|jgi:hypothetical protein|nr:hypothetical protein [Bdellovibrionota bacterium]